MTPSMVKKDKKVLYVAFSVRGMDSKLVHMIHKKGRKVVTPAEGKGETRWKGTGWKQAVSTVYFMYF